MFKDLLYYYLNIVMWPQILKQTRKIMDLVLSLSIFWDKKNFIFLFVLLFHLFIVYLFNFNAS